jgi:heat shock protein HslJ
MALSSWIVAPLALSAALLAQPAEYRLTSWVDGGQIRNLPSGAPITLQILAPGLLGGSAGVNRYTGGYTLSGENAIAWQSPHFATTSKAGPAHLMQLEADYLRALPTVTRARFEGPSLILSSEDGLTLTFTSGVEVRALPDLFGSEHILTRFTQSGVELDLPPTPVTLTLQREGRVTGAAAVNRYFANYHLPGEHQIALSGPVGSTRRAGPPALMDFDTRFFLALPAVQSFRLESGILILEGPGLRLEFRPSEALQ